MDKYTEELKHLFKKSENEAIKHGSYKINDIYLLLAILSDENIISKTLNNYNITYNKVKKNVVKTNNIIGFFVFDENLKKAIESCFLNLREKNIEEINSVNLFLTILNNKNSEMYKTLKKHTSNINLIYKDLLKSNIQNTNLLINDIGINLNELTNSKDLNKTYNRENEINRIIEILARKNKNNPLLIGDAGVGKTAIIEELARNINNKNVPSFLQNKTIISLNISNVIAGTKYRGEFEEKLGKIIKELEYSNDLILFVDEMHTLMGAGGAEGAIDAANILKPVLARNNVKVIGATTINEYKKYIEKDKAFDRRFQKVLIKEPTILETESILLKIKKDYEKFHNVKISNNLISELVKLTSKYIKDKKEPDRSIDILDEVCAYTKINNFSNNIDKDLIKFHNLKKKFIKNKDYNNAIKISEKEQILKLKHVKGECNVSYENLITILSNKTNQKIDINNDYTISLLKLKYRIIGQNTAINELITIDNIIRHKTTNKPISVLINGPTGTGKTECIKNYAKILNLNFIRLDMSEFNNEMSINKILGSPQGYIGYDDNNNAFESLKLYPNSIILLDEIDKANPKIINLLFSVLDEGIVKNSKNEEINFSNSTIFLTTNHYNKTNNIGFKNTKKTKQHIFSSEFLNRINYFIEFNNLSIKDIKKIINLNLKLISEENKKNIKLSNIEIDKIIKESEYEVYGARKIYNIINKHLEYKLMKI